MDISERTLQLKTDIDEVYEAGKKAEHNEFWDNGINEYNYLFAGRFWNKETFKPNKDFVVLDYCFYYHNWLGTGYDLAKQLEDLGVKMTIGESAHNNSFRIAWFTRLPVLDFSKVNAGSWGQTFCGAVGSPLTTIDKIILPPEGTITKFDNTFYRCYALKNITFEGVIDKSISFSDSPLSVQSLKNIISCLKDFSSTDSKYKYTITFKASEFNVLEAEGATAEYNGVACTWAELIDNKKWNLVKG